MIRFAKKIFKSKRSNFSPLCHCPYLKIGLCDFFPVFFHSYHGHNCFAPSWNMGVLYLIFVISVNIMFLAYLPSFPVLVGLASLQLLSFVLSLVLISISKWRKKWQWIEKLWLISVITSAAARGVKQSELTKQTEILMIWMTHSKSVLRILRKPFMTGIHNNL